MTKHEYAYIAREPECGCTTFITVDDELSRDTNSRELAKLMRQGMTVEHVTVQEARDLFKRCPHWKITRGKRTRIEPEPDLALAVTCEDAWHTDPGQAARRCPTCDGTRPRNPEDAVTA